MSDFAKLAKFYEKQDIYVRERRDYSRRRVRRPKQNIIVHKLKPATQTLRPNDRHEILGERTGLLDRLQGVAGYFFGGGWVFGFVEHERFRATAEAFQAYYDDQSADLVFRAGDVSKTEAPGGTITLKPGMDILSGIQPGTYRNVAVKRSAFKALDTLPRHIDLREIDRLSFVHDRTLRERDEAEWSKSIKKGDNTYCALTNNAHLALRNGLKEIDWRQQKEDWRRAKSKLDNSLWRQMGSLIAYEESLGRFSEMALGFAIFSDITVDVRELPARPKLPSADARVAPPIFVDRAVTEEDLGDGDWSVEDIESALQQIKGNQKSFNGIRDKVDDDMTEIE